MRDLRFRAWDKERKKMFVAMGVYGYEDEYTKGGEVFLGDEKASKYFPEQVEVMQFTGLTDKNGKEIYEGDLVTGATSYELPSAEWEATKERPAVVKWNEDCAGFFPFILGSGWRVDVVDIEVIGNIHENPDLLNARKD